MEPLSSVATLESPPAAPDLGYSAPETNLEEQLAGIWREAMGLERVGVESNFFDLGGDSLMLEQIHGELEHRLGVETSMTALFPIPDHSDAGEALGWETGRPSHAGVARNRGSHCRTSPAAPTSRRSAASIGNRHVSTDLHQLESQLEGIAVVGLAGRFPQARNVAEYWENLRSGRECLTEFTEGEIEAAGVPRRSLSEDRVRSRGVLPGAECFDPAFFGFSPREAEILDPQQRVFLELAWEALEDAGYEPERAPGSIGVFAGVGINTYFRNNVSRRPEVLDTFGMFPAALLNEKDFVATRVAYKLNLRGPAVAVQTACSTSLVAVCNACQSLLNYECDAALAGAAAAVFPQCHSYVHEEGGMIAHDGDAVPSMRRPQERCSATAPASSFCGGSMTLSPRETTSWR